MSFRRLVSLVAGVAALGYGVVNASFLSAGEPWPSGLATGWYCGKDLCESASVNVSVGPLIWVWLPLVLLAMSFVAVMCNGLWLRLRRVWPFAIVFVLALPWALVTTFVVGAPLQYYIPAILGLFSLQPASSNTMPVPGSSQTGP